MERKVKVSIIPKVRSAFFVRSGESHTTLVMLAWVVGRSR